MPEATHRFLVDFFTQDLPFTPTSRDVALFEIDLKLVSPHIMQASLKEVAAGRVLKNRPISEWRQAIFQVYNRKVAEHAQLFPVLHCFETAFRSTIAVELETHYRRRDWWAPVHGAVMAGRAARTVTHVNNVPLHRRVAFLVDTIVRRMAGKGLVVADLYDGYEFAENCDLSHIGALVLEHWPTFGPRFRRRDRRLSAADFRAKFNKVRDARNDIYHHKSVPRMTDLLGAAEELLDYLDFSLRFVVTKIGESHPAPLAFRLPVRPALHHTW